MTTASGAALTTITSTTVAFPTPNYLPGLTSVFTPAPACFWNSYDINPTDGLDTSSSGTIFKGVTSWCYPPTFYGPIPGPTKVSTTSDGTALAVATVTMALYSPAMCPYGYVTVSESMAERPATVGGSADATTTYATCCPSSHSMNPLGGPCTSLATGASASITIADSNITTTTMALQNQQVVIAASPVIVAWQASDLKDFVTTTTTSSIPSFTPTFVSPPTYPSNAASVVTVYAKASDHRESHLSPGAAAGIGVGVGVGTLALLLAGLVFWRRHRRRASSAEQPDDDHLRAEKGEQRRQVPPSNNHAASSTHTTTSAADDHDDDDAASKDRRSTGS